MDLQKIINETAFCHRVKDGVSVGILVSGSRLHLAAAFQNPKDKNFNRSIARYEIARRIAISLAGNSATKAKTEFVIEYMLPAGLGFKSFFHHITNRDIVKNISSLFRKRFKPDPNEKDDFFSGLMTKREDQWIKINNVLSHTLYSEKLS